jgi:hypothetical protein
MRAERDNEYRGSLHQGGFALLVALIALSLISLIGLFLSLAATSEVRVSDNYESLIRARAAGLAGLNHARALLKGLSFNDLLQGPDGTHDASLAMMTLARSHGYRSPLGWPIARMLDILDPADSVAGMSDDGIVNTGRHPGGQGVELIPLMGVAQIIRDPNGPGTIVSSRYFVKVSDNNGDASELAQDPADDPFLDGDGQIIVRSMGIAQTLREDMQSGHQRNSVALFEARFKRFSTFDLEASLVVQGSAAEASSMNMFGGSQFLVHGGVANPGIGTIDAPPGSGAVSAQQIISQLSPAQRINIQGSSPAPSVRDITPPPAGSPDKRLLLDLPYLRRFFGQAVPQFADSTYSESQSWSDMAPQSLGSYDPALPATSPGQDPRVTYVNGDLIVGGNLDGAGVLVIAGKLSVTGQFRFYGLVLVAGTGEFVCGGQSSITGAVYVANLSDAIGGLNWGTAKLTLEQNCRITLNREAVRMAVNQIPPTQLGFREITSIIDP